MPELQQIKDLFMELVKLVERKLLPNNKRYARITEKFSEKLDKTVKLLQG